MIWALQKSEKGLEDRSAIEKLKIKNWEPENCKISEKGEFACKERKQRQLQSYVPYNLILHKQLETIVKQ